MGLAFFPVETSDPGETGLDFSAGITVITLLPVITVASTNKVFMVISLMSLSDFQTLYRKFLFRQVELL
jgi:hypothetical protein